MDATNITAEMFSHAPSSQRENPNEIFTSERLEKSDELVDTINNLTRNNSKYELNTATAIYSQGNLMSNPDTVTHNRNRILDQQLLSCQTIREDSVLTPPTNPSIDAISLAPPTLLTPTVKQILADAMSGNAWTDRNPQQTSKTGVHGSIPMSTPIHSEQIF